MVQCVCVCDLGPSVMAGYCGVSDTQTCCIVYFQNNGCYFIFKRCEKMVKLIIYTFEHNLSEM